MSYKHLTKISERFLKQTSRSSMPSSYFKKLQNRTTPEFMKTDLPHVKDSEKFSDYKDWKFLPGDRVVITKSGEWKGQVAKITTLDKDSNGYILDDDGPKKWVPVPKDYWVENQKTHMAHVPIPVTQNDIKLVADVDDPQQEGKTKVVAVRDVVFRGSYYDENYKRMMPYRCVAGQENLVIPWPKPRESEDGVLATDSEVARTQTFFVESIVKQPIPEDAFLNIRNPKSRYRRGTLTSRDIAKLVGPEMPMTKAREAYIKEKDELRRREKPKLTDDDMELIGSRLYKHFAGKV
ncbi:HEL117Wp [Eremothecium sinecaudum]|uniref:HEL117Wp n=1 Tax=Eremothecium sinecaudum TaxID=45286 RepID=A0A109UZJ0_9SACH|nr:HEL117Wp [Eremothecium sinecaudum]AMD21163.1 HEL117Wp [Eremothecium sinecaudum]